MKTIVGLFDTKATANKVKDELLNRGFDSSSVSVMDADKESYSGTSDGKPEHETVGERIKHFFSSFGEGDHSGHEHYTSGVERGGAIVSVRTRDEQAADVADLLDQYGASEVEDRYANDGAYGDTRNDYVADRTGDAEQVIPVVQEELEVGKRQVNRGGVRVYSHIVETPVSENISLHDERILVERRAVNRPASAADFNTGSDSIELTAMGEEAVVGKRSRIVEEVTVGKVGTERTEQIKDSVRHTEVDVEEIPAENTKY